MQQLLSINEFYEVDKPRLQQRFGICYMRREETVGSGANKVSSCVKHVVFHPHDWMQLARQTGNKTLFNAIQMQLRDLFQFSGFLKTLSR
jgi:hypothetical protein